jgi:hypothetical protein
LSREAIGRRAVTTHPARKPAARMTTELVINFPPGLYPGDWWRF